MGYSLWRADDEPSLTAAALARTVITDEFARPALAARLGGLPEWIVHDGE
jgi:hypothetical protein